MASEHRDRRSSCKNKGRKTETSNISAHTERETKSRGRKWRATFYLADPVQGQDISAVIWHVCVSCACNAHTEKYRGPERERQYKQSDMLHNGSFQAFDAKYIRFSGWLAARVARAPLKLPLAPIHVMKSGDAGASERRTGCKDAHGCSPLHAHTHILPRKVLCRDKRRKLRDSPQDAPAAELLSAVLFSRTFHARILIRSIYQHQLLKSP